MKSVLISIQPKWCELIASGKKTIEIRKTKPKIAIPFKCYIYMTDNKKQVLSLLDNPTPYWETLHFGKGKVIGEFVCDKIGTDRTFGHDVSFYAEARMSDVDIASYCVNPEMYCWHISDLVIYDKPKELSEFATICVAECSNPYKCDKCEYSYKESYEIGVYEECCCNNLKPLKRPPQSWCYVENDFKE